MGFEEMVEDYVEALWKAAMDGRIRTALERAVESYRKNLDEIFRLYPYVREKAERLREVKDHSLRHMEELAREVKDRVEDQHGSCIIAETGEKAIEYIREQVEPGDVVVKSKSMTTEEIELNRHLEERGCEVYETDLGEFIVQRLGSRPMHITSPAIHVPREQVAELFSEIMGREMPPDPKTLVAAARRYLRHKFIEARVGISGANAIAAETGTVFIIENEGNARLVTGLPEKHIVVAGLEKIVLTLQDGLLVVEVTSRYASYKAPTYVNLISGASKTGDIEKQIVYGAHGPRELHLVLLDNHRTEMARDPVYRQALRCLRCGACLYECTVYPLVAGYFGHVYMGGIGAILTRFLVGGLERSAPIAYTCTLCGRCREYCPMDIDVPQMMLELRRELAERGLVPERMRRSIEETTGLHLP
jgi:L-lactate dehydrogenase complex protein LldG